MQPISKLIHVPKPTTKATSERAELIGYFADSVNKERKGTKYKPVSYAFIATKLSHLSKFDLYHLKRTLEDYQQRGNSFSKGFFGSLKPKPEAAPLISNHDLPKKV